MSYIQKMIKNIKKPSVSYKAYTSAFALIIFIMIISMCVIYSNIIKTKLLIIENLEVIRNDLYKEYEVLLSFNELLKNQEVLEEIIYDENGEVIEVIQTEVIIEDFLTSFGLVSVTNEDDYYVLEIDNIHLIVYGSNEGIESFSY